MTADAPDACLPHPFISRHCAGDSLCAGTPTPGLTYPLGRVPRPILLLGVHTKASIYFKIWRKNKLLGQCLKI